MKPAFNEIDKAISNQDLAEAERLFDTLPKGALTHARALLLAARIAMAKSDPEGALVHLRKALKRHGPSQNLLHLRALALRETGDQMRYRKALEELNDHCDSNFAKRSLSRMALQGGQPMKARKLAEAALSRDPACVWAYSCLLFCLNKLDAPDSDFIETLDRAADHCAEMPRFWRQTLYPRKMQEEQARVARLVEKWPDNLRLSNGTLLNLSRTEDRQTALKSAKNAMAQRAVPTGVEDTLDDLDLFLRELPTDDQLQRTTVTDDGSDVVVSDIGPSGIGIVFFGGLANRYGLDMESLDRFIAAAGHTAIYLRDRQRCLFLKGIPDIPGSVEGLEAYLRDLKQELGLNRLVMIGSSSGGLAALKYGVAISADGIRCFGGPTTAATEAMETFGDARGRALTRRLSRDLAPEALDVAPDVAKAAGSVPIQMYYGAEMPQDSAQAERLRGIAGVSLLPVPDVDRHDILFQMIANQRVGEVLSTNFQTP